MASPTRYVIEIQFSGGEPSEGSQKPGVSSAPTSAGSNASGKSNKNYGKKIAVAGYGIASQVAQKVVASYVNTVELRTGQQLYQERLQFVSGIASRVGSMAIAGAVFGGAGGALAGAAIGLAMQGVDYLVEEVRLDRAKQVERIGLDRAAIRAGAGGNRGGKDY